MKALALLQPAQSIAAMQSINVVAVTPAFMTALPGIAAVAVAVWAVADWNDSFCPYLLAGSASTSSGRSDLRSVPTVRATTAWRRSSQSRSRPPTAGPLPDRVDTVDHARVAAGLAAAASLTLVLRAG
jgi:uncharacterized membrane protein